MGPLERVPHRIRLRRGPGVGDRRRGHSGIHPAPSRLRRRDACLTICLRPLASAVYAATQGLHVISGLAAIPLLLAKLWSVIPKLYEWPPVRSVAHGLERLSLALLVGGSLFVFATGVLNIQLYYPFRFTFVPAHYFGAVVFVAALGLHVGLKLPTVVRAFRQHGVLRPLRVPLADTGPEPQVEDSTAPIAPGAPTISMRGFVAA